MTPGEIFKLPMQPGNDADATTIGDYFKTLMIDLWEQGEGFSGKRPFGNSGWEYEVYWALGMAGLVEMSLDEDGFIQKLDTGTAHSVIRDALQELSI
jgi:hypothetical protein